ncbi:Transposable element Tc1 transposase [Anthophora retusa]
MCPKTSEIPESERKSIVNWHKEEKMYGESQSPDINRIEHLRAIIGKQLQKFHTTSKASLKEKLFEAWNSISPNVTEKLINSMHNRLQDIISAKGGHTKY